MDGPHATDRIKQIDTDGKKQGTNRTCVNTTDGTFN